MMRYFHPSGNKRSMLSHQGVEALGVVVTRMMRMRGRDAMRLILGPRDINKLLHPHGNQGRVLSSPGDISSV